MYLGEEVLDLNDGNLGELVLPEGLPRLEQENLPRDDARVRHARDVLVVELCFLDRVELDRPLLPLSVRLRVLELAEQVEPRDGHHPTGGVEVVVVATATPPPPAERAPPRFGESEKMPLVTSLRRW